MQLTGKRIIATAMDMIERDGAESVSMQRLATELGCGLMSLYSHVPSRPALLDGVAEAVLAGVAMTATPDGAWPAHVRAQAIAVRHYAMARPRCTLVALGRPPTSTAALRLLEAALASLREAGFAGPDAVRIVRVLSAYLMGSLLREVGVAPGLTDSDDEPDRRRPRVPPTAFPNVTDVAADLSSADSDADFEFGLDRLLQACHGSA